MSDSFRDRVAVITGGASGLGLAMGRAMAARGSRLVLADIDEATLAETARQLADEGTSVLGVPTDVTKRASVEALADAAFSHFGGAHIVCNNAGVAVGGRVDVMDYNDWDWVMGVNLDGVINGVQTFVNRIKAHGEGGHFVNTASMAGQMPIPGGSIYTASKYAVVGMSEVMKTDLARHDIGVSVLCPGGVSTNVAKSGRNRPADLLRETDTSQLGLGELSAPVMADMLEAAVIGDMVLAAVLANDLYIFSHPGLKPVVDARSAAINESFERWSKYRKDHGV